MNKHRHRLQSFSSSLRRSSTNHPNFNVIRYLNPLKPRVSFCQCAVKQSRPLSFYFQIRKETKLLLTSTRPSSFLCPGCVLCRPLFPPQLHFFLFLYIFKILVSIFYSLFEIKWSKIYLICFYNLYNLYL